ncbi:Conserved_hypothetical protein [Hexamita inflata]|uniref:Major capsid protein n=1 Tax=Hexamita inflata TaxID=28002 RepID=A0AA86RNN5_9EUKA|nr:Conserved hypothetical protein [Hexamita inflata]
MSSKDLNVIPAKVTAVESLSNDVYVSSSHDGLSIKVVHVNKSGSNTIDFDHLIKEGNSTEIQWEIQCLQNSVLSTTNSGIKYTMQFGIKMAAASFGRYYWKNGFVYFQKATIASYANLSFTLAPPVVVCTTAMNSTFPIYESIVNYNGELKTTDLFRKSMFQQMLLPKDYQETMSQTWFEGDTIMFDEYVLPYDEATKLYIDIGTPANWDKATCKNNQIKKLSDDSFIWTFRKDFFIPLNMLNQVFNYSNNFYTNTIKKQSLYIMIRTQLNSLAKCFGSSKIFNEEYTGIGLVDLQVVTKSSQVVQSDMAKKANIIIQNGIGVEVRPMTTMYTDQTLVLPSSSNHMSVARAALVIELKDQNTDDSTYLHQRFTGMSAQDMLDYRNQQLLAEQINNGVTAAITKAPLCTQDFVFFGNYNIHRGNETYKLFTNDLQDLQSFRNEIIRSTNMSQQYDRGLSPAFSNMFEWLSKYAFTFNSLEQFSMDECTSDVVGDGYNSIQNSLFFQYQLVEYRNGRKTNDGYCNRYLTQPTAETIRAQNMHANTIRIQAYTFYDTLLMYDMNNGQINIKDFQ